LRLERICLRSLVGNKFGYNVIAACITTPTLYCSANRKPTTWTQKAPMHRRTVNIFYMLLHIRLLLYLFHNIQLEWHCIAWLCWCAIKKLLTRKKVQKFTPNLSCL